MKEIINWCNANSGFITALGILFGSGILSSYLDIPKISDLNDALINNKHVKQTKGKYYIRNIQEILRFLGKIVLRFSFISLLLILVLLSIIHSLPQKNNKEIVIRNSNNRVLMNSLVDLSTRVLIPEQSKYTDVDMVAIEQINRSIPSWEAITSKFKTAEDDPGGLLRELECEILKNPLVGDMIAQGLHLMIIANGLNLIDGNTVESWIDYFYDQNEKAYALNDIGLNRWVKYYSFEDGNTEMYVTDEYRIYAEQICAYLNKMVNYGVQELTPEIRYYRNCSAGLNTLRAIYRFEDDTNSVRALILGVPGALDKEHIIGFALSDKSLLIYIIEGKG